MDYIYKIGDKVKLQPDLVEGHFLPSCVYINDEMEAMSAATPAKIYTIRGRGQYNNYPTYWLCGDCWEWAEDMLRPATPDWAQKGD